MGCSASFADLLCLQSPAVNAILAVDQAEEQLAVHLRIHGRVQGVGYRDWLEGEAVALQVDGWVRNRSDGTVEALLSGDEAAIDELVLRCEVGPRLARVDRVERATTDETAPIGFAQRATS